MASSVLVVLAVVASFPVAVVVVVASLGCLVAADLVALVLEIGAGFEFHLEVESLASTLDPASFASGGSSDSSELSRSWAGPGPLLQERSQARAVLAVWPQWLDDRPDPQTLKLEKLPLWSVLRSPSVVDW